MNIKLNFDAVNVKDTTENLNVKILMVKGEKGDPGSGAAWGNIGGNITEQTDLNNILSTKANSSDLNNYYNKTETDTEIQNAIASLGTVFNLVGSVATVGDLPATGNEVGDVYYVQSESAGFIWINDDGTLRWEELGMTVDLTAYYTKTETNNLLDDKVDTTDLSPVATSGSYNDLSNKPSIPTKDELVNVGTEVDEDYRVNIKTSINLYNKDNDIINKVLSTSGTLNTAPNYCVSDYIKVKPNTTYTISRIYTAPTAGEDLMRIGYYKNDKTFIDRPNNATNPWTITTPNNCYYVRLSYNFASNINIQIEEGSTATTYKSHSYSINTDDEVIYSKSAVLWSNPSGDSTNIPLNENPYNYKEIEIFFKNSWISSSVRINIEDDIETKSAVLSIPYGTSTDLLSIHSSLINITTSAINFDNTRDRDVAIGSSSTTITTTRQIKLTKVIGYK